MNKKRNIIVLLLVLIAVILSVLFCLKQNYKTDESAIEPEEIVQQEEVKVFNEASEVTKTDDSYTDKSKKPVTKTTKTYKPAAAKTVSPKEDSKTIGELTAIEEVIKDNGPAKVVIVDKEYKFKSPSKYFFKSRF